MLVPHDFSSCAESALEVALALAEKQRASLTLLHESEHVTAEASAYVNRIDNYIYFAPAIGADGLPIFDVIVRGAFPRFTTRPIDAVFYGAFQYDDHNSLGQDAYSLVNLRLAATGRFLIGEVLVRNLFDTRYIPFAFPYPNFAPSGYVGEMGAPRTVSVSAGVRF